ncbi:MAG: hypothetical protein Q8P80_03805 [Candidatus Levybacteria bacterium]|nr:hypothetical protein [Candidatus Levybacteria bacterium]
MNRIEKSRIDELFNYLHATKMSADEIYSLIGGGLGGRQKGLQSEYNVVFALARLPCVCKVRKTERRSVEDLEGNDMTVYFPGNGDFKEIGFVRVQVKSSNIAIHIFENTIIEKNKINRTGLAEWLLEHKLIILNGQIGKTDIAKNFMEQLARIQEYRSTRNQSLSVGA